MRKILIAALIICSQLQASCKYESCNQYAKLTFTNLQTEITSKFNDLLSAIAELDTAYGSYLSALSDQNELYRKLQILKAENALTDAEKLFELKKANNLIGLTIEE